MEKIKRHKGFTLAELLVVVAIIGVLVAIAIPVFSNQLEKSRDAVTIANIRQAYAEAQYAYITRSTENSNVKIVEDREGFGAVIEVYEVEAKGKKRDNNNFFSGLSKNLPFENQMYGCWPMDDCYGRTDHKYTVQFIYDENGEFASVGVPTNTYQ